jgi:hypothetical protein
MNQKKYLSAFLSFLSFCCLFVVFYLVLSDGMVRERARARVGGDRSGEGGDVWYGQGDSENWRLAEAGKEGEA